jgi:hypothetical protein
MFKAWRGKGVYFYVVRRGSYHEKTPVKETAISVTLLTRGGWSFFYSIVALYFHSRCMYCLWAGDICRDEIKINEFGE